MQWHWLSVLGQSPVQLLALMDSGVEWSLDTDSIEKPFPDDPAVPWRGVLLTVGTSCSTAPRAQEAAWSCNKSFQGSIPWARGWQTFSVKNILTFKLFLGKILHSHSVAEIANSLHEYNRLNYVFPPHSPPNWYVETLTPSAQNVTVFGDRVFTEVIKLKWGL